MNICVYRTFITPRINIVLALRGCAGLVKLTLSGSLPVINSERYPPPRPLSQHQAASASAAAAPASAPVAPEGEFQDASRGDSQAAVRGRNPRQPSEPASKSGTG